MDNPLGHIAARDHAVARAELEDDIVVAIIAFPVRCIGMMAGCLGEGGGAQLYKLLKHLKPSQFLRAALAVAQPVIYFGFSPTN